jgi:hypothetical protein
MDDIDRHASHWPWPYCNPMMTYAKAEELTATL